MGEKVGGSGSLAGVESQLEGIGIHKNDANTPAAAIESVDPVSEDEKKWIECVMKGESCKNQQEVIKERGSSSKIERILAMLREVKENSGCYNPLVVSIGPYHHGNPRLELMQKHKLTMVHQFVHGDLKLLEELYQKVRRVAEAARQCYTDQSSIDKFNDEEFSQMMFLDACFLLQFIDCYVNGKLDDLKMKSNMVALVRRDLLLLENQIPFQLLNELSFKFEVENNKTTMLNQFVGKILSLPPQAESCKICIKYFLCNLVFGGRKGAVEAAIYGKPAHLLDLIRTSLFEKYILMAETSRECSDWSSYRSVKELKAVGIKFRPSKTDRFNDVSFQSGYLAGILKLPRICIDDSTKSMLLNMVAYESCPDGPDDFGVSSYLCLMDSLIDHAEDVRELRLKGILLNFLGSDQHIVDLFNEMSDSLVSHPNAYAIVKDEIERHYKNRVKIWLAEWLHTHFTSPWTVLAFIGAVLALFLRVIQTYEVLKPCNC